MEGAERCENRLEREKKSARLIACPRVRERTELEVTLKGFALRRRGLRDNAALPRGGTSGEICALVNLNLSRPWLPRLLWEHRILAGKLRNPYQYTRMHTRSCTHNVHTQCLHTHAHTCTQCLHAQCLCMHMQCLHAHPMFVHTYAHAHTPICFGLQEK